MTEYLIEAGVLVALGYAGYKGYAYKALAEVLVDIIEYYSTRYTGNPAIKEEVHSQVVLKKLDKHLDKILEDKGLKERSKGKA